MKTYTPNQIEIAKRNYNAMLVIATVESYNPESIGWAAAEQRCEFNNQIVTDILNGNKELANKWKLYYLNAAASNDFKIAKSIAKLTANKDASADILAPIKQAKRLSEFGKWLNTNGNKFRTEHFSKKYTQLAVDTFLTNC